MREIYLGHHCFVNVDKLNPKNLMTNFIKEADSSDHEADSPDSKSPNKQLFFFSGSLELITRELIQNACSFVKEEKSTQRKTFGRIMPVLYMLRKSEGYSLRDISKLLGTYGFKLKATTIHDYYYDYVMKNEKEYDKQLNELTSAFHEIKQQNNRQKQSTAIVFASLKKDSEPS